MPKSISPVAPVLRPACCVTVAACLLVASIATASARPERYGQARLKAFPAAQAKTKASPPGPLLAVISVADQRISVYGRDGLVARSAVSTGMAGYRTPTGLFSVIGKERWHRSNIYSGAPMPLMQRITWSGVALHAGVLPGYPASHGCIRLHHSFAEQLWGMTKVGTRVVVAPRDSTPERISHPQLPTPAMLPAPEREVAGAPLVAVAMAGRNDSSPRLLNPVEWALAAKTKATAEASAALNAAKAALDRSIAVSAEARRAVAELRAAEAELASARAILASGRAQAADLAREGAEQRLSLAMKRADEARSAEAAKTKAAFAAADASKQADRVSEEAAENVQELARRTEPVSIFISRKEGKLFVRQSMRRVFEVPVTIKDPDRPLGTHQLLATETSGEGGLRWIALSLPPSVDYERHATPSGRNARSEPAAPTHHDTAAAALSRIEIPADVMQRLSERVWTGASLVISDYGISQETGEFTDFIILTPAAG